MRWLAWLLCLWAPGLGLVACDGGVVEVPPHPCDAEELLLDVAPPRDAFGALEETAELWCGIPPQGGAPYTPLRLRVQGPLALFEGVNIALSATDAESGEELAYTALQARMTCANVGESAGFWVGSEVHMRYPGFALQDLGGRGAELRVSVTSLNESVVIEGEWPVELLSEAE